MTHEELEDWIQAVAKRLSVIEERVVDMPGQPPLHASKLRAHIAELEKQGHVSIVELEKQGHVSKLRARIVELEKQRDAYDTDRESERQRADHLEKQLAEETGHAVHWKAKADELEDRLKAREAENSYLKQFEERDPIHVKERQRRDQQIATLQAEYDILQKECNQLQAERGQDSANETRLYVQIRELTSQRDQLLTAIEGYRESVSQRVESIQADNADLRNQLNKLLDLRATLIQLLEKA